MRGARLWNAPDLWRHMWPKWRRALQDRPLGNEADESAHSEFTTVNALAASMLDDLLNEITRAGHVVEAIKAIKKTEAQKRKASAKSSAKAKAAKIEEAPGNQNLEMPAIPPNELPDSSATPAIPPSELPDSSATPAIPPKELPDSSATPAIPPNLSKDELPDSSATSIPSNLSQNESHHSSATTTPTFMRNLTKNDKSESAVPNAAPESTKRARLRRMHRPKLPRCFVGEPSLRSCRVVLSDRIRHNKQQCFLVCNKN